LPNDGTFPNVLGTMIGLRSSFGQRGVELRDEAPASESAPAMPEQCESPLEKESQPKTKAP
jgi:hypothetical protein